MQYEIKNSKRVAPGDQVRFRCKRCAECCRHVEQTVVIEGKDGYELAKHIGISVPEFYEKYTETFILPDTCYPIMALKVYGPVKSCIFLKRRGAEHRDGLKRRNFPHAVLKILGRRQPSCVFCLACEKFHSL